MWCGLRGVCGGEHACLRIGCGERVGDDELGSLEVVMEESSSRSGFLHCAADKRVSSFGRNATLRGVEEEQTTATALWLVEHLLSPQHRQIQAFLHSA